MKQRVQNFLDELRSSNIATDGAIATTPEAVRKERTLTQCVYFVHLYSFLPDHFILSAGKLLVMAHKTTSCHCSNWPTFDSFRYLYAHCQTLSSCV